MLRIKAYITCLAAFILIAIGSAGPAACSGAEPGLSGELKDGVRVVKMEAFRYGYRPDPVVVNAGEKVRLLVTATDVMHGFGIAELGINRKLPPGKETVIEFTAPKAGTYSIDCTVFCGPGHGGMEGRLIVR